MLENAIATSDPLALTNAEEALDQDELLSTTNKNLVVEEASHDQSDTDTDEHNRGRAESDWPQVSGQFNHAIRQFEKEIRGIR